MAAMESQAQTAKVVRRSPTAEKGGAPLRRRVTYDASISALGSLGPLLTRNNSEKSSSRGDAGLGNGSDGQESGRDRTMDQLPMAGLLRMGRRKSSKEKPSTPSARSASTAAPSSERAMRRSTSSVGAELRKDRRSKSKTNAELRTPQNADDDGNVVSPEHQRFAMLRNLSKKYQCSLQEVDTIATQLEGAVAKKDGLVGLNAFRRALRAIFANQDVNEKGVLIAWEAATQTPAEPGARAEKLDTDAFMVWYIAEKRWVHLKACTAWAASEAALAELVEEHGVHATWINAVKDAFDLCDDNGSGIMDYMEFADFLAKHPGTEDFTEAVVARHWTEADEDGSGGIDFPEFLKWHLRHFDSEGNLREDFAN